MLHSIMIEFYDCKYCHKKINKMASLIVHNKDRKVLKIKGGALIRINILNFEEKFVKLSSSKEFV